MSKRISLILYFVACLVTGYVMLSSGFGFDSSTFWVVYVCLIVSHITGDISGSYRGRKNGR